MPVGKGDMEIEFNPSRFAKVPGQKPVARSNAIPRRAAARKFGPARTLEQALQDVPMARTEQVERARALLADAEYPSAEMMDRIASLLALHLE